MKKKFIAVILALVCAMTCAFAFTACGSSNPKKVKSDTVTAEQWAEAFKADNFKNVKIESTVTDEDSYMKADGSLEEYKVIVKSTIIVVDGVQYYKSEATVEKGSQEVIDYAKEFTFEKYSSVSDGKCTVYSKDNDGKWKQSPGLIGVADGIIAYYVALGTKYDEFEHQDGWVKGYWLKQNTSGQAQRSYKFKKGKLVVVCTYEDEEVTTFVYGKQQLTLPTTEN